MSLSIGWLTFGLFLLAMVTRALPFMLGKKMLHYPALKRLKIYLPGIIFILVTIYELREIVWAQYPYGLPTFLAIISIVLVHHVWRNAVLSMFLGFVV
jgi:branched-subunit amino acid transport protein AzlD